MRRGARKSLVRVFSLTGGFYPLPAEMNGGGELSVISFQLSAFGDQLRRLARRSAMISSPIGVPPQVAVGYRGRQRFRGLKAESYLRQWGVVAGWGGRRG